MPNPVCRCQTAYFHHDCRLDIKAWCLGVKIRGYQGFLKSSPYCSAVGFPPIKTGLFFQWGRFHATPSQCLRKKLFSIGLEELHSQYISNFPINKLASLHSNNFADKSVTIEREINRVSNRIRFIPEKQCYSKEQTSHTWFPYLLMQQWNT